MTKSVYGDRETVGTLALEAAQFHDNPVAGDIGHELMPSLVDDLNEAIASQPFGPNSFYITIYEKKDLQLKNVLIRRVITQEKRPYPEPNSIVFWSSPKTLETLFCWCLPHQTVMGNYVANPDYYVTEQVEDVKAYLDEKLEHFGFKKIGLTEDKKPIVMPIENFKDRKLGKEKNLHFKT